MLDIKLFLTESLTSINNNLSSIIVSVMNETSLGIHDSSIWGEELKSQNVKDILTDKTLFGEPTSAGHRKRTSRLITTIGTWVEEFNWLKSPRSSSGAINCSYSDTTFTTNKNKIIENISAFSQKLLNMKQVQFMFDIIPNLYTIIIKKINKLKIYNSRLIASGHLNIAIKDFLLYILFYHFHKIDYKSGREDIKMWEIIDKNVLFNNVRAAAITQQVFVVDIIL